MELLLSLFSSTGAGSIVGMVGSWLTKREERKNLQLVNEHEKAMANIRVHEQKLEASHELAMADKQLESAEVEGNIAIDQGEIAAFNTSLLQQSKSTGIAFVEAIRGLMRPLITLYLLVLVTYLAYKISVLVNGLESISSDELVSLYQQMIHFFLSITSTAICWWFGSRPSTQRK